jgi:hypothetical protein
MSEFVPPPELPEQLEDGAPQAKTLAERIADWAGRRFRGESDEEGPGFLRIEAVKSGMGTAVGGIILFVGFCVLCGLLTCLWLKTDHHVYYRVIETTVELPGALKVLLMIGGGFSAVMALFVILSDTEEKGRVLHWIFFIVVACATLSFARYTLVPLALIAGQFYIHYIIHSGIRLGERRREWELEMKKEEEEDDEGAKSSPAGLLRKYAGVRGFEEAGEAQASAGEDDGEPRRPKTPPG